MTVRSFLRALLAATLFIGLVQVSAFAGDDWKPVDPADLALKAPVVETDADAEAIFWDVRVDDEGEDLVFTHYIRIKVFTERGKESQGQIDIPFLGNTRVKDIAGRTIKPDGSIVELKKDAVFERTIVKVSGAKLKAKSFAMPAVEPGAVIEYRYREIFPFGSADNLRLPFQRDIPVQVVRYHIKPFQFFAGMRAQTYNAGDPKFLKEKDGFYLTEMSRMPAFHEEPHMPPEDQVRTWTLLYYSKDVKQQAEAYWHEHGKAFYEAFKPMMKANDDIKKAVAQIAGDAATPQQKLERLYTYCQTKIKNVDDDASGMTAEDLKKAKKNDSPADTFKHGMGTGGDIDLLFAAMASAAGFETRIALMGDRSRMFADFSLPNTYFVKEGIVAVKIGTDWSFFEPSSAYCPYGMLRWRLEGQQALIPDSKEPVFVRTPLSPAEKSAEKRSATLTLSEDGTLEGDVQIEYTGQLAMEKKEDNDDDSPEQREQNLRDMIKARMSTAEVSDVKIENVTDPVKPFVYRFHVVVPGYAQRTGKRLFLQPAFFEKGAPALFTASTRKHQIYFHYPWTESDTVTITLPKGFALDNADQPAPFNANDVAKYEVKMGMTPKNEQLVMTRKWTFNALIFPQTSYNGLKKLFELLHENDNHTITLKQQAAAQ
ncbi:MAG TPA: DUF3857 and transglutaminase domain-containing protein [Blastocatellia bacterium]|nr:DUF3857 and transglutaminase domain-containing protein [Blastocatellia bacterium]